MKIYFVRHGESKLNAQDVHQHTTVSLSEKGKQQAEFVAKRFDSIPIDVIYSSDFTRAHETAEIIGKHIHKQVEINILLRERKNPTELHGKKFDHPDAMTIKTIMKENGRNKDWHYSDEENMFDVMKRCKEFITFLTTLNYDHVLVVSHGIAIRMIIACMMLPKEELIVDTFEYFGNFMHMNNTGITVCEKKPDNIFQLLTWNDYAHLP